MSPSIDSCSRTPSFPTPRVPPFLSSPVFYRYYVGAKTPFPPALARTYLAAQSRGVGLVFIGPLSSRLTWRGRGRCCPVSPSSGCCSLVWCGSPVFHGLPFDGLPCSSTPPVSSVLALRTSVIAPVITTTKAIGYLFISWLIHTAFHLAVYASCRPLGRRCKTRLQCGATRLLTGFLPAWEALRRFRPSCSPLVFRLPVCSFVSVICLSVWFLLSGLSPPPCLCTAPCD